MVTRSPSHTMIATGIGISTINVNILSKIRKELFILPTVSKQYIISIKKYEISVASWCSIHSADQTVIQFNGN